MGHFLFPGPTIIQVQTVLQKWVVVTFTQVHVLYKMTQVEVANEVSVLE